MKNKVDKTLLLKAGTKYDLRIYKLLQIDEDKTYFIGIDKNGLRHLVPEVYYRHYGIKTGDIVRCRLDRINCLGRFFFEPDNPLYKLKGVYHFKLRGINFPAGVNLATANVEDKFGNEWETLPFSMKNRPTLKITTLLCRVKAFKKARMFLETVDPRIRQ
jgi:hypothetical protein